uniref:NAD-dependent epimerase/dehydratase domain-containing protein n=1 Tax=viral metagenome TaxID=1070528 RepID=A0A6C0I8X5_9ZZZZ
MKVLIYGSKGWIGSLFTNFLDHENVKYTPGESRVDNESDLLAEINDVNPTHVISFIGRTHGTVEDKKINTIDYLEYPGKLQENIRDNLFSVVSLANICSRKGIHYTYLGTGCIFNGTETPFTEESLPNYFGSGYSIVKGFTDRLMKQYPVLNLRIRMPISSQWNERNFITKITRYEKICSIPNSMTVLDDFFPIILDLMEKSKTGTYNCTNPGLISHNEILKSYREIIDPNFEWTNFTLEEQSKVLKSDRSNNYLDTSLVEREYPDIKGIKQSIVNVLLKMKK